MTKVFFHSDGRPTRHPTTREESRRRGRKRYDDDTLCPDCRDCRIKYTATARCIHCARLAALDFYNETPADKRVGPGFMIVPEACGTAGHVGLRTDTGECFACLHKPPPRSNRQEAIRNGETWYKPERPCTRCGTYALRHVHRATCQGCPKQSRDRASGGAMAVAESMPADTTITRAEAIQWRLPVYRTGKRCRNGHASWRYTSTGACMVCLGRLDNEPGSA